MIESLYGKRVRNTIGRMESPRRDLTFAQLKIYYDARRLKLNDSFMKNLELLTPDDRPNYAAYLLADENGSSLQVAKYAGKDRVELIENRDYGRCSIVKALKSVLDRVDVENTVFTKIGYPLREERELIDSTAMREAVINAVVHNDYSYGAVPKVEFFADRAEVTSMGGLPYGVTEADFFGGCSVPRNKEIMRVFRDLEIVEHLGSGVPRILKAYGRDAFEIRDSYIRIAFRFKTVLSEKTVGETAGKTVGKTSEKLSEKTSEKISAEAVGEKEGEKEGKKEGEKEGGKLSKNRRQIIDAMRNDPFVTHLMLAGMLEMTPANVDRNIKYLKDHGWIKRVGPDKGGHWEVIGEDAK
jgi:predicted HTH transcriptional regulator